MKDITPVIGWWMKDTVLLSLTGWRMKELFSTMRTGVPRINACIRSQHMVYFLQRISFFIKHTQIHATVWWYVGHILKYGKNERKKPLLGKMVPWSWWRIPILAGPLLGANCPLCPLPSLTPRNCFLPKGHLFTCRRHWHACFFLVWHTILLHNWCGWRILLSDW
jgi:hypothetical protein